MSSRHEPTLAGCDSGPCGGGDIRGFYAQLGIELPDRPGREAPVRCFADPDSHRHGDRHPSTSVSLVSGASCCHGCGAAGGAYDAAILKGHSPRSAIDLLVRHGLTERRTQKRRRPRPRPASGSPRPSARPAARARLTVGAAQLAGWAAALAGDQRLVELLERERCWTRATIATLGLGADRGRVVIPVHGPDGELVAVLRYDPHTNRRAPKLIAAPGSRRDLYPAPETLPAGGVVIVEGEPDAIAAHSAGLPAVAIPGTGPWRRYGKQWALRFAGRDVLVIADADPDGRCLAETITADLRQLTITARLIDLHPDRSDGADLTDWLRTHRRRPVTLADLEKAAAVDLSDAA